MLHQLTLNKKRTIFFSFFRPTNLIPIKYTQYNLNYGETKCEINMWYQNNGLCKSTRRILRLLGFCSKWNKLILDMNHIFTNLISLHLSDCVWFISVSHVASCQLCVKLIWYKSERILRHISFRLIKLYKFIMFFLLSLLCVRVRVCLLFIVQQRPIIERSFHPAATAAATAETMDSMMWKPACSSQSARTHTTNGKAPMPNLWSLIYIN